ncbi:hypothetical protein N9L68_04470 [bacterium]|nr:hypothetical protein [bacterium]
MRNLQCTHFSPADAASPKLPNLQCIHFSHRLNESASECAVAVLESDRDFILAAAELKSEREFFPTSQRRGALLQLPLESLVGCTRPQVESGSSTLGALASAATAVATGLAGVLQKRGLSHI